MPKLHQIVALVSGKKTGIEKAFGDAYKTLQKPSIFTTSIDTYTPLKTDGETLPEQKVLAQAKTAEIIEEVARQLAEAIDLVATQEAGNIKTSVELVVDGKVLAKSVPVGTLFFLEKKLEDIRTFVSAMPTLDADKTWTFNQATGGYVSDEVKTFRTKKVQKPIVLYDATDKHPAQTQLITEDENVGTWTKKHTSYALPGPAKKAMLDRVNKLTDAVKLAREGANSIDVQEVKIGQEFLKFIFG